MEILSRHISDEFLYSIGWTIFHSVWIGAVVSLLLFIVLTFMGRSSAKVKYNLSLGALTVMVILISLVFINTLESANLKSDSIPSAGLILSDGNAHTIADQGLSISYPDIKTTLGQNIILFLNSNYSLITILWMAGILFMALRFTGGLIYSGKLRNSSSGRTDLVYSLLISKLKKKIGIERKVEFIESLLARVPLTTGWIKPVIYIPVGALAGLPYNQVEAIFAHELAHIKRNDYLVNIFQSIIEIILFYHPAVWWISSVIRSERESACDEIAVEHSDEKLTYIKALVNISELEAGETGAAVAFAGDSKNLLNRIKRITKMKQAKFNRTDKWTSALMSVILIAGVVIITGFSTEPGIDKSDLPVSNITESIATDHPVIQYNTDIQQDTIKLSGDINRTIIDPTDNKEKDARFTFKNGELTALTIEGKMIPESDYHLYESDIEEAKNDMADVVADMEEALVDMEEALAEIEEIDMEEIERDIQEALQEIEEIDLEAMELEIEDALSEIQELDMEAIEFDMQEALVEIEESLEEIENIDMKEIEFQMQKALQEIQEMDLEKMQEEMRISLEGVEEIDMQEIMKQMEKSMEQIKESLKDIEIDNRKVLEDHKKNFESQKKQLEKQLIEIQEQETQNKEKKQSGKKKKEGIY